MTIEVLLYRSKILKNGEHPIMLRVTQIKARKYISLGISCKPKWWDFKKNRPKNNHPDKEYINLLIDRKKSEYHNKNLDLKVDDKIMTPIQMVESVEKKIKKITVFDFFEEQIKLKIKERKTGSANTYKDCLRVLKIFTDEKDFFFSGIDKHFLVKMESSFREKNYSESTMSIYFRTLRIIYNKAIDAKCAKQNDYPFQDYKISRFKPKPHKRAITKEDIYKIIALDIPEKSTKFEARQIFIFSFYCQGMNFIDIAFLKWSNLENNNRLIYVRKKTNQEIRLTLLDPAKEIIEYYRPQTSENTDNYIFAILNNKKHITPTQINDRLHKVLTRVNKDMKEIGKEVSINVPLTTYVARHTFATALKRSGVSTALISELMGHQSESITQTYLNSFEDKVKEEAMKNLL